MLNRMPITAPLVASVAFIAVLVVILAVNVWGVVTAALGPGTGTHEARAALDRHLREHEDKLAEFRQQFDGRSIFREPPPTPRPQPPRPDPPRVVEQTRPDPEPVVDTGPPPPPATYAGRDILFVVGDSVWFADTTKPFRVDLGEIVNGHRVLAVNAPRTVRVGWSRGEYDVPIFTDWNPRIGMLDQPPPRQPVPGLLPAPSDGPGSSAQPRTGDAYPAPSSGERSDQRATQSLGEPLTGRPLSRSASDAPPDNAANELSDRTVNTDRQRTGSTDRSGRPLPDNSRAQNPQGSSENNGGNDREKSAEPEAEPQSS